MRDSLAFVVLLAISNTFMTIDWCGHRENKQAPLIVAFLVYAWIVFKEAPAGIPWPPWA
jgi:uncharacterized protein (DUF486 family)